MRRLQYQKCLFMYSRRGTNKLGNNKSKWQLAGRATICLHVHYYILCRAKSSDSACVLNARLNKAFMQMQVCRCVPYHPVTTSTIQIANLQCYPSAFESTSYCLHTYFEWKNPLAPDQDLNPLPSDPKLVCFPLEFSVQIISALQ